MKHSLHVQKNYQKSFALSIPGPIIAFVISLMCGLLYAEYESKMVSKYFNNSQNMIGGWMKEAGKTLAVPTKPPIKNNFQSGFEITPRPTKDSAPKIAITNSVNSRSDTTTNIEIIGPTLAIKYNYDYSSNFPTIKPGDPGSKEWSEEFWKKFEEMGRQNAASQKAVEEAQRQFCAQNPDLCNR